MLVVHISAECYPAAKVGGLADVVGSLPGYQRSLGMDSIVLIPKYGMPWIHKHQWTTVFEADIIENGVWKHFTIEQLEEGVLDFPLLVVNMPEYFDRPGVYDYPPGHYFGDETARFFAFQHAAIIWLSSMDPLPDLVHCHDHHTGLIPFFMKYAVDFINLNPIPSVFTIHNGNYQGMHSWKDVVLLPRFHRNDSGLLDWNDTINSMASGIRNSWRFTTVSPSYMNELKALPNLGNLVSTEAGKGRGILNGIDYNIWNPKKDPLVEHKMKKSIHVFKRKNKEAITTGFELEAEAPLFVFIGRFAREKGAFILPDVIGSFLSANNPASFIILGSGDEKLSGRFHHLSRYFPHRVKYREGYDEPLAHMLYAAADFLIMPSLVEPCGLNQMYSMHYGTIPVVRAVGGLNDTVIDIEQGGGGFRFGDLDIHQITSTLYRAMDLYGNESYFNEIRERIIEYDFSWEHSAKQYEDLYNEITH
jgi:starch synthase